VTRRFLFLLPFLTLLLPPCLLLWPVLVHGEAFLPADLLRDIAPWRTDNPSSLIPWNPLMWDGIAEFYPWRFFAAQTLHSGYLPLWNPHQFCGTPFVANSQSAVFYPPNLLFCLLPVSQAFGVSVLLHLFLTGGFMYAFLCSPKIGLGRAAALLGAVAWQLCHWQVAWLELPTFLCVSAWLPLALLLVDRTVERPTARRAGLLGICCGLMLLAGHLQIALYCLGLVTVYALFRAWPRLRPDGPALVGCTLIVLALAFGLAAPQILPTLELAHVSHRAGGPPTWAAYTVYIHLALPSANLITLWLPGFFGNPTRGTYWGIGFNAGPGAYMENACYGGVLALLLALAGVWATWRQNTATRFFGIAAVVSLLLALGTPLNALAFFGIPGFAQTGSPGRILVLWSFCIAVLAALGAQRVLEGDWGVLMKSLGLFTAFGLLALGYAVFWFSRYTPTGYVAANLSTERDLWRLPLGLLLGTCAALWLRERGRLTASQTGATLIVLVGADLLAAGYGFNRTTAPQNVYPMTPLIAYLQAHRSEGRIMPVNRRWSLTAEPPLAVLPPNTGTVYGLDDTQGYDSLLTGQYFQFAGRLDQGSPAPQENGNMVFTYGIGSAEAREAGARYVVTREPLPGGSPVFQDNGEYVYEDTKALPRIRLTGERLGEEEVGYSQLPQPPTRLRLIAGTEGLSPPQKIVVADQWYPGWHSYYGGEEAILTRGPDIFRTVTLTPKQRGISPTNNPLEMRYEPEAFRVGLYALCLAVGGAAALSAAAGRERLSRRRRL
jgi:hypothetical protein